MTNDERIEKTADALKSPLEEMLPGWSFAKNELTTLAEAALEAAGMNELVGALEKIGGTGWSSPEIDGRGADTFSQIFFEIQNIAQAALTGDTTK